MPGKVLLTGGRGFFGRRLLDALRTRGYDVAAPGRPDFDLLDKASVERTLNAIKPDLVVNSAAYYGGLGINVAEPHKVFHDNVLMICHLVDAAARAGVKRFVVIGSSCAYPAITDGDLNEDDFWNGRLHSSVEGYGFTKKVQEVAVNAYAKSFGMQPQHPILTNLYGEDDVFTEFRSHVVAALIKKFADAVLAQAPTVTCWGTGAPVREFLYVGDAAEGVARLIDHGYDQPLNLGTGVGVSIRELADLIAKHTGFQGEVLWESAKPDGVSRKVMDVSRMKHLLNWEPEYDLERGLQRTIAWYLAHKESADARP